MKRIFSAFIVCLIFQIGVSAQQPESENSLCPKISVTVSPEVINDLPAGDPLVYKASLKNPPENSKIEYFWTVVGGKIISGQGTPIIKVDMEALASTNPTATVEVKGLPENCPNTVSETPSIAAGIIDNCLGGYGKLSEIEEAVYLDNLIIRLRSDSSLLVRVHLRFPDKATAKQIDSRISRIAKHFAYRRASGEIKRVIFVISPEAGEEYMGICYFSVSSKDAYCDECEIIRGADLDLSKYLKSKKPKK